MTESDWASYLRAAMRAAGYERPADLARDTGLDGSLISRWLSGTVQPGIPHLRKLVPALRIPIPVLAVAAGHFTAKELQLKEIPKPPPCPPDDPVEAEIRAAGYPEDLEKALLKARQDNRDMLLGIIAAHRSTGSNGSEGAHSK